MTLNLSRKLIGSRLVAGSMVPGEEIALRIDQVLLSDVLGTLVMLELEAMGVDRVRLPVAAQYVDHNLVENDHLNAEEHLFLRSACRRLGVWYSRAGNGISHPVHMQRFGKPGDSLAGSDSHTPAAGCLGMLAFGAGGVETALAMAGEPLHLTMPQIWGVRLVGRVPDWVSAKDVILEMLRRHGVRGGVGRIIEYHGSGLAGLSAMDRHVLANMGAELGATTSVFPSDDATRAFLRSEGREQDWQPLAADPGASYDVEEEIDLGTLEPLIATPSSPGNVVRVRDIAGAEITQSYVGSSANPGYRDIAVVAMMMRGRQVHDRVSLDINPSSRQVLQTLIQQGRLHDLVEAGARIHQPGCNGCIGMGQAPAAGRNSLRTVPRNFPGRSGTVEDRVFLCSPETAAASALTGVITDPRDAGLPFERVEEPANPAVNTMMMIAPLPPGPASAAPFEKTANIVSLPGLPCMGDDIVVPILLKVGDDISTDDIIAAGTRVMPLWSNVPRSAEYTFEGIDPSYAGRARQQGRHGIIGGANYGQGSSRENAAIAPRYLGLDVVVAKSFARIHWQNLVNFGVLPLTFADPADYDRLQPGDTIELRDVATALRRGGEIAASANGGTDTIVLRHELSSRQLDILLQGGVIPWFRERHKQLLQI